MANHFHPRPALGGQIGYSTLSTAAEFHTRPTEFVHDPNSCELLRGEESEETDLCQEQVCKRHRHPPSQKVHAHNIKEYRQVTSNFL